MQQKTSSKLQRTKSWAERILARISQREQQTCWRGTAEDADLLRLAWWTVWFAAYQHAPNPYDAALRKMLGPRYRNYIETHNTLPAYSPVDPAEYGEVDGRNGSQWVRSVMAYLDWRAGDCWRPVSDRNLPARRIYTDASLELSQAFNSTVRPSQPKAKVKQPAQPMTQKRPRSA